MSTAFPPNTQLLLDKLMGLKRESYTRAGHPAPLTAALYAVADIMNMYKTQPQYLEQLLGEEIEDAKKALI